MKVKIQRQFSNTQVDKAGKFLASWSWNSKNSRGQTLEFIHSFRVLNYWRSLHTYSLNTFNSTLRDKVKRQKLKRSIIAQRLKRTPSIINKLKRFKQMNLSLMQDIGGLRAILDNNTQVQKLTHDYKNSRFDHVLVNEKTI